VSTRTTSGARTTAGRRGSGTCLPWIRGEHPREARKTMTQGVPWSSTEFDTCDQWERPRMAFVGFGMTSNGQTEPQFFQPLLNCSAFPQIQSDVPMKAKLLALIQPTQWPRERGVRASVTRRRVHSLVIFSFILTASIGGLDYRLAATIPSKPFCPASSKSSFPVLDDVA